MERLCALYSMFSLSYFVYLAMAVAIVLGVVFACKNLRDNAKKVCSIVLVSLIVIFAILEYLGRIISLKEFNIFYNLPVELVHVLTYVCVITLITNSSGWSKFLYIVALPLSIYSLLIVPNFYASQESFSLITIGYVFSFVFIIAYSLVNIVWKDVSVRLGDVLNSNITYLIFFASVHLINVFLRFSGWATEVNIMGTMGEEYDVVIAFIYNLIPYGFICNLPLIAIIIGIQCVMVMPFVMSENRKIKQEKINELIALGNAKAQQEASNEGKGDIRSQIIVKSEKKAMPDTPKKVNEQNSQGEFLNTNRVIQINHDVHEVHSTDNEEK